VVSRRTFYTKDVGLSTTDLIVESSGLLVAALAAFWPVWRNGFVNWDDPTVLTANPHLAGPAVLPWAFSTTLIGHYQPLSWLTWSGVNALFGLSPPAFHGLSLIVHLANGLLVYVLTRRLCRGTPLDPGRQRIAAVLAASIFLLHPASVEAVAWASAFPYVLALLALLLSAIAYLSRRPIVSLVLFAISLSARAVALGYPLVLLVMDVYPLRRHIRTPLRRLAAEKIPFAVLACIAGAAEWMSRDVASVQEVGLGARATMTAAAPFVYIARTFWPLRLSPLNPLPISPTVDPIPLVLGIAGMAVLAGFAWHYRDRYPAFGAALAIYLVLLAPVAGLTPSGLQATADRYMYFPAVVVALLIAVTVTQVRSTRLILVAATVVMAALGTLTWKQAGYWKDSTTLWTRAAEMDPRNDVATYNLAIALAESGRTEDAMTWYERTIALVPDHDLARQNLARLQAAAAEKNGDRLAAAGRDSEASGEYARALSLDARRSHARAAGGMLMMKRGQLREAAVELARAIDDGVTDPAVPNALAFALVQNGDDARAAAVLERAVTAHPDDLNLAHNLARLLATSADVRVRNSQRALRLALEVCDRTGNSDPRTLDTLAAAYAAAGRLDEARATAARAAERARALGDGDTAAEIAAHARRYR
jgi:protein O-mannosyl-transferase